MLLYCIVLILQNENVLNSVEEEPYFKSYFDAKFCILAGM